MTNKFKSNNKSVFIPSGNLIEGFTVIPNGIMNNISIMTPDAFTVFAKILQYISNPDHKINIQGLSTQTGLTKDRVSKGLKKLIEIGYIVRTPIKKGNLTNGYIYEVFDTPQCENETVENTTFLRNPEIQDTETQDTEFQYTNKENRKKENRKKENNVVVVVDKEKETQLLEMYKSFKIEKRCMPHTAKLLKEYINKFDLEVFEQVFIAASEDSVKKKYAYIKATLEELDKKNIKTLDDMEKDNKNFKVGKGSNNKTNTKGSYVAKPKNNKFHNFKNRIIEDYTPESLDIALKESQERKYGKDLFSEQVEKSLEDGSYFNSLPVLTKNNVREYILSSNDIPFKPLWIK